MKIAEIELLGWTSEEEEKAWAQACLGFDHGGHDMQPRSEDRYLFHLAAWLEAMDEDELSDEAGTGDQAAATHEAGSREFRPLNFNGRNSAIFEGETVREFWLFC